VRDGTAVDGATMLGRMTLLIPVGALIGGALADRVGDRLLTVIGLVCCVVGFWLMSHWALAEPEGGMTVHLALTGFGFGLIIAPITATALHWVRLAQAGLAAALINTARMIGALLGLSIFSAWGLELFKNLMAPYKATDYIDKPDAYAALVKAAGLQVYTAGFLVAAILCAVALLPALGLHRPSPAQAAALAGDTVLPGDDA
jgi:MFS family permease